MPKRSFISKSLMNTRIYKLTPQKIWDALYNHPKLHWRLHFLELRQDNCGNLYTQTNIFGKKTWGVITGDRTLRDICHWLWLAVPQYIGEVVASNEAPKITKIMVAKTLIPVLKN